MCQTLCILLDHWIGLVDINKIEAARNCLIGVGLLWITVPRVCSLKCHYVVWLVLLVYFSCDCTGASGWYHVENTCCTAWTKYSVQLIALHLTACFCVEDPKVREDETTSDNNVLDSLFFYRSIHRKRVIGAMWILLVLVLVMMRARE